MRLIIIALFGIFTLSACEYFGSSKKSAISPENPDDMALFALGYNYGEHLRFLNLSEQEISIISQALESAIKSNHSEQVNKLKETMSLANMERFLTQRSAQYAEQAQKKGEAYLEKFVAKGGVRTPSGLAYRIITPGNDKKPSKDDVVELHYHGTLINGEVFDSSIDRKNKLTAPLNATLKGWQEALPLIGEGGELELVVPAHLGYGDSGSLPRVGSGETLVYHIQLFKVQKIKN